ncbi:MAG: aminopeptidase P family N-terminal domain-containing protein, partial [Gammaproteobacteria bacterium]|nr:aminopeptidase P family N-terminal domain-containing protein [Gammaproteobacteria bacterium]
MNKISTSTVGARQHGAMEFTDPPADLDKVRRYRLQRVREQLKKFDYAGILVFNQINTRYITDATNMQVWCAHYETRCVFVATEGPVVLFDYGDYPHLAEGLPTVDEYRVNKSFYFFTAGSRSPERAGLFADEIADLVAQYGGGNKRLAVDRLSYEGTAPLLRRGLSMHSGEEVMELARAIKSTEELTLMQHAV